jgi:hypothetical protein
MNAAPFPGFRPAAKQISATTMKAAPDLKNFCIQILQ